MSATETAAQAAANAGQAATNAATHAFEIAVDRLHDVEWPAVEWPDVALDDVFDDVSVTVRRHPTAVFAIVALSVVATCGVLWFAMRRRRDRSAAEETELRLAGVA